MLADSVRILSSPARLSKPMGFALDLSGPGTLNPLFLKFQSFFSRALEAVPHAGAKWMANIRSFSVSRAC